MHCKTLIEPERNQKTGHFTMEQHPHESRLTILDKANNSAGLQDDTLLTISLILSVWYGEETRTHSIQNKCKQKSLSISPIPKNACSRFCSAAHPEETLIKDRISGHKDKDHASIYHQ